MKISDIQKKYLISFKDLEKILKRLDVTYDYNKNMIFSDTYRLICYLNAIRDRGRYKRIYRG